ncbi:MAG: arginine deiminase family protein [Sulfolobus sp.]
MIGKAKAEWEKLKAVALHKPGLEVYLALIEPKTFLYQRRFSFSKARREYEELIETLKGEGIKIYRLLHTIARRAEKDKRFYGILKEIVGIDGDPWFLSRFLLLKPEIRSETEIVIKNPLANMYFMRDQQITTDFGIIIGKMAKVQRRNETEVAKLFWRALNVKYVEVTEGFLEGGDFFPMGDFYLVGVGNRSDLKGAEILIKTGKEVAVVHEERSEEFFHLDTYFNVASSNTIVGVKQLMERNRVEVYIDGKKVEEITFLEYIKRKGFNVYPVSVEEARNYATNFLTIDDGKIISPVNLRIEGVDVITVNIKNLSGGFGGIHCMTAVVERG